MLRNRRLCATQPAAILFSSRLIPTAVFTSHHRLGQLVKHCESKLDQVTVARHEGEAVGECAPTG